MDHLKRTRARIKFLKYVFLSASLCVLVAILATLYVKNTPTITEQSENTERKAPKLSKGFTLSINHSVFEGISGDMKPYKISAKNVSKNSSNKYVLTSVSGEYALSEGELIIKAESGALDEKTKFVTLSDKVQIIFNGIIFNSDKINFNLNTKDASSEDEIKVLFKKSHIRADKFETEDSGNSIRFEGNVESTIDIDDFDL